VVRVARVRDSVVSADRYWERPIAELLDLGGRVALGYLLG